MRLAVRRHRDPRPEVTVELEMRTKVLFRRMALVPPPALAVVFAVSRDSRYLAAALFAAATAGELHLRKILLADGVVHRRGLFGWVKPLELNSLRRVRVRRYWSPRDLVAERRLIISDRHGAYMELALVMWDNWQPLVQEIAIRMAADGPDAVQLRIPPTQRTLRFLAEFLPASGRPGTSDPR